MISSSQAESEADVQDQKVGITSSPHSRASRSFPLALFQISKSCYSGSKTRRRQLPVPSGVWTGSTSTNLDSPFPDLMRAFLRLRPLERCAQGPART